jgi:pimeloyl-ACP methyl ester carboxylesterase
VAGGLALALAACPAAAQARPLCEPVGPAFTPHVEVVRCGYTPVPEGATCGLIVNAATPDDADACKVTVPFVRLPATGRATDDVPAVLLPGGPGQVLLYQLDQIEPITRAWRQARDLIVLDPRGGGASLPSLFRAHPARARDPVVAIGRDAAWLRKRGVDLDAFRTERLVDDVAVLAASVPGGKLHVVGGSYGTRWALALVATHPDKVASLVLGAPVPPTVSYLDLGQSRLGDVLDQVFDACARDARCAEDVPDPWGTLSALITRWDAAPVRAPDGAVLDGAGLVQRLQEGAKQGPPMQALPWTLRDLAAGDLSAVARLSDHVPPQGVVPLLYHVITCADELPFAPTTPSAPPDPRLPGLVDPLPPERAVCAELGVTPSAPASHVMPQIDVSTLIVVGRLDPLGGPLWGDLALQSTREGVMFNDASAGHGVLRTDCAGQAVARFLTNPADVVYPACIDGDGLRLTPP